MANDDVYTLTAEQLNELVAKEIFNSKLEVAFTTWRPASSVTLAVDVLLYFTKDGNWNWELYNHGNKYCSVRIEHGDDEWTAEGKSGDEAATICRALLMASRGNCGKSVAK